MKRLITVILIMVLILPAAAGSEDLFTTKLGDLTFDQLMILNKNIQIRLFQKGAVSGVIVPAGVYKVGEDIPEGTYRIEYTPLTPTSFCSFMAVNEEPFLSFFTLLGFDSSTEVGKLELPAGTEITLTGGSVTFSTYTGLFH